VAKIAELVEAKTLEGVVDVRDESDRQGLRVVVEVRKREKMIRVSTLLPRWPVILPTLPGPTSLQHTFSSPK